MTSFLQGVKDRKNVDEYIDPNERYIHKIGSKVQSRIQEIEKAERANRDALVHQTERLLASQKGHGDGVLERMGFSVHRPNTWTFRQRLTTPTRRPESPLQDRTIRHISEEKNRGWASDTNQECLEDDPFFEKKLRVGGQMAVFACKVAKVVYRSPSPLSSVDSHTPDELRAISQFVPLSPTPPPKARPSRLPVLQHFGGAGKEVADGCKFQTAQDNFVRIERTIEKLRVADNPPPKPPAKPKRVSCKANKLTPAKACPPKEAPHGHVKVEACKVPAPPRKSALPNRKGPRRGTKLRPQKAVAQEQIKPLANPANGLVSSFINVRSDEWETKLLGLKAIRALAQHHQAVLLTKLPEACIMLAEEVGNLRSVVSCAAIDTVADLHTHLGKIMDPEVERTGGALLLKLAQTTNAFIHQQANLALDALVQGSSPARIMNVLFNMGSKHRCPAVRASTARHLQLLADIIGMDQIFEAGKFFAEHFLTTVSKMAVDAAPDVRHHGQILLQGLAYQNEFSAMWVKIIPMKDRVPLQKILQKMRQ
ncbi:hypothetical protein JOQ06_017006 [Pogonophryne albipinna]|uniref:TOG domain-containing protein n=1 Tax=Pogonophryne albipinna TaxID=1090488 RepID=A0AAD6B3C9_9TELE|nr:hypothetical protein JOQ06_017006 [Pogonophryne albipinna]